MPRFRVLDSFCDVSECVLAGVSELTVFPDCDCDVPVFQSLNPSVLQTLSLLVSRCTSGTIFCVNRSRGRE